MTLFIRPSFSLLSCLLCSTLILQGCGSERSTPVALTPSHEQNLPDTDAGVSLVSPLQVNTVLDESDDDTTCSLRDAILTTNSGVPVGGCAAVSSTIHISATGLISLGSALPPISGTVSIQGPGESDLSISGNDSVRVFEIPAGARVNLDDLTITSGVADQGGGILNAGTLTVTDVTVANSVATVSGGGIFNSGRLVIRSSTIDGNSAPDGGGIHSQAGVLSITDSTISNNSSSTSGGGVNAGGTLVNIANSQFEGNQADQQGGAIEIGSGSARLNNNSFTGNTATGEGNNIFNDSSRPVGGNGNNPVSCDGDAGIRVVLVSGGDPVTLTLEFTTPGDPITDVDSDVVLLQDLSGSFFDDVPTIQGIAPDIVAAFPNSFFGVTSFVDKPISPFGSFDDFVYNTDLAVTDSGPDFVDAINTLSIFSGNDFEESQLEALFQAALRAETEVGFRDDSQRIVVLTTDAPPHLPPDGAAIGLPPNNGDAILDGTPPGTGEDYPSIDQVREAVIAANIIPIFLVTSGQISTYENIVAQLGFGTVVELTSNSSNLIAAITEGITEVNENFVIVANDDDFGYVVDIVPDAFTDVPPGTTISFDVILQAPAGSTEDDEIIIQIQGSETFDLDVVIEFGG